MPLTESLMPALGTSLPAFSLPDVTTGRMITSTDVAAGGPVLVMFICRHCPFTRHVAPEIARIGRDYANRPLGIVGISASDVTLHPEDAPASLAEMAAEHGLSFPFCYDETQEVAKAFQAACTPEFFLYDADHRLVYRGRLDDSRMGSAVPVTGRDLRAAIDAVLDGRTVDPDQRPSAGCNVKWKPGQQPDYLMSKTAKHA